MRGSKESATRLGGSRLLGTTEPWVPEFPGTAHRSTSRLSSDGYSHPRERPGWQSPIQRPPRAANRPGTRARQRGDGRPGRPGRRPAMVLEGARRPARTPSAWTRGNLADPSPPSRLSEGVPVLTPRGQTTDRRRRAARLGRPPRKKEVMTRSRRARTPTGRAIRGRRPRIGIEHEPTADNHGSSRSPAHPGSPRGVPGRPRRHSPRAARTTPESADDAGGGIGSMPPAPEPRNAGDSS